MTLIIKGPGSEPDDEGWATDDDLVEKIAAEMAKPVALIASGGYSVRADALPAGEYPGFNIISLDDLSLDTAYDIDRHYSGCASIRGRTCTCEYLGQWK